jgi:hypothetical protein
MTATAAVGSGGADAAGTAVLVASLTAGLCQPAKRRASGARARERACRVPARPCGACVAWGRGPGGGGGERGCGGGDSQRFGIAESLRNRNDSGSRFGIGGTPGPGPVTATVTERRTPGSPSGARRQTASGRLGGPDSESDNRGGRPPGGRRLGLGLGLGLGAVSATVTHNRTRTQAWPGGGGWRGGSGPGAKQANLSFL